MLILAVLLAYDAIHMCGTHSPQQKRTRATAKHPSLANVAKERFNSNSRTRGEE